MGGFRGVCRGQPSPDKNYKSFRKTLLKFKKICIIYKPDLADPDNIFG